MNSAHMADMETLENGSEELIDDDGYPTDGALDRISTFTRTAEEMSTFVQSLMHNGGSKLEDFVDDFQRPGKRLTLVTGGWSGCESVIGALQGTMFHLMGWESSFRGGKHTYTFTPQQWGMSFAWGKPTPATEQPSWKGAMSQHKVATETSGDSTQITVDGILWMSIVDGHVTIRLANEGVYVERDPSVNGMTITPYHPRLANIAPELRDQMRIELGLR